MNPSTLIRTALVAAIAATLIACSSGTGRARYVAVRSADGLGAPAALQPAPRAVARSTAAAMPAPGKGGKPQPRVVARRGEAKSQAREFMLDGFNVYEAEGGRLWVFRSGSEGLASFLTKGEPAKRVTLIAAGPEGRTLMGSETQVLKDFGDSWRYAAPGFAVIADDGRLWVFRAGSAHHEQFKTKGEPAKRVTLIGRGPDGRTLMGAEKATLEDYARGVGGM